MQSGLRSFQDDKRNGSLKSSDPLDLVASLPFTLVETLLNLIKATTMAGVLADLEPPVEIR